jgi:hypothetical protein
MMRENKMAITFVHGAVIRYLSAFKTGSRRVGQLE